MSNLPVTTESLKSNGSSRSVTRAVFPSGATAVRHYHTEYNETFKIVRGQLIVVKGGKDYLVRRGEQSPMIEIGEIHTYRNDSGEDVTVDIILQPGHQGCEAANLIFTALARDNQLDIFSKKYSLFWLVFYDITNTIPVGVPGVLYSLLGLMYGRKRIEAYKAYLLKKASLQ
jgi:quercetin dioxygenase-like cupin family protein